MAPPTTAVADTRLFSDTPLADTYERALMLVRLLAALLLSALVLAPRAVAGQGYGDITALVTYLVTYDLGLALAYKASSQPGRRVVSGCGVALDAVAITLFIGEAPHSIDGHLLYVLIICGAAVRFNLGGALLTGAAVIVLQIFVATWGGALFPLIQGLPATHVSPTWTEVVQRSLFLGIVAVIFGWLMSAVTKERRLRAVTEANLVRLASTDPVTGLLNHGALKQRLAEELSRAKRYDKAVTVMMIDLDNFKQYNDTFGHAEGDHILHSVADCLRVAVRAEDTVYRYGGEEFCVICPEIDATARLVGERVRMAITQLAQLDGVRATTVSASIGVAVYPHHADNAIDLLQRADAACYQAKRDGKNRVVGASVVGSNSLDG